MDTRSYSGNYFFLVSLTDADGAQGRRTYGSARHPSWLAICEKCMLEVLWIELVVNFCWKASSGRYSKRTVLCRSTVAYAGWIQYRHVRWWRSFGSMRTTDNEVLSLAVIDDTPRDDFSPRQRHTLKEFAVSYYSMVISLYSLLYRQLLCVKWNYGEIRWVTVGGLSRQDCRCLLQIQLRIRDRIQNSVSVFSSLHWCHWTPSHLDGTI